MEAISSEGRAEELRCTSRGTQGTGRSQRRGWEQSCEKIIKWDWIIQQWLRESEFRGRDMVKPMSQHSSTELGVDCPNDADSGLEDAQNQVPWRARVLLLCSWRKLFL